MKSGKIRITKLKEINWHKLILELFVVFLGVSSGFILNNWREDQKEKKLEYKYLISFFQNVENNISELENNIQEDTIWIEEARSLLRLLNSETKIDDDSVLQLYSGIIEYSKIDAQTNTYEDIKNSGNLNVIRDFSLKELLVKYHKGVENVEFIDEFLFKNFQEYMVDYLYQNVNLIKGEFIDPDISSSYSFSNSIMAYLSIRVQRLEEYKKFLEESRNLRSALQKYILTFDNGDNFEPNDSVLYDTISN